MPLWRSVPHYALVDRDKSPVVRIGEAGHQGLEA